MRGMIEVTDKESGRKMMVNISYLEVIFDEGMTASLCLMMRSPSRKATHYTIETEETYWEVKELISRAQLEEKIKKDSPEGELGMIRN